MSAPETLNQLKSLVNRVNTSTSTISLGPRAFQTLARLVDEPQLSAVYSITDLAARLDVNPSTLTRLAKRLGYSGFNDLQSVFRRHVAGGEGTHYLRKIDELINRDGPENQTLDFFLKVVGDESSNLAKLAATIDPSQLETASSMLCSAREVRIHGLRQFYSMANFLSYGLGLIRNRVSILGEAGHGIAHSLSQLNCDDLLVVLGCNPYTRATVDSSKIAAQNGIPILAFTDSSASPLATNSQCTFVIPSSGDYYVNGTAAWATLLEGLLILVARDLGDSARQTLHSREILFQQLGISL
ncbi:MAG: RpiR family transcriptional regulator [marine bacterium B5-7]|nr:MAG: RpiR family transcriptional regulator [marine bacterium B5-7]